MCSAKPIEGPTLKLHSAGNSRVGKRYGVKSGSRSGVIGVTSNRNGVCRIRRVGSLSDPRVECTCFTLPDQELLQ